MDQPEPTTAAMSAARALRFPWQSVGAPQHDALSRHAQQWAERLALVPTGPLSKKLGAVDVGKLAALVYPGAPTKVLELFAEFFTWIFLQDDVFDEAEGTPAPGKQAQTLQDYIDVLSGVEPAAEAPAPTIALADLRAKLVGLGGPAWFDRFSASMRRFWLDGVLEETRHRAAGIAPGLARYKHVRLESVCVYPVLDLIEIAYGLRLSPALTGDPLFSAVREQTAWAIAMSNDVFSYGKERRADDPHNVVHLLTVHKQRSLDEAFSAVVGAHNTLVARFDGMAAALQRRSSALRAYVEGHRRWMRGAYDWQLGARRYAPTAA